MNGRRRISTIAATCLVAVSFAPPLVAPAAALGIPRTSALVPLDLTDPDASLFASQVATLIGYDTQPNDQFGRAVAVCNAAAVVGVSEDSDFGASAGAVYVFERNQGGADAWLQMAKLTASDAAELDWFGHGVSISGNTIVVGAPFDDGGGNASGGRTCTGIRRPGSTCRLS